MQGQGANLAGRDLDPLSAQFRADLLALAVVHEARQTDPHLDVVAVDRTRRHQPLQLFRAPGQPSAGGGGAACGTDAHAFVGAEGAVGQSDDAADDGFLDQHATAAARTGLGGGLCRGADFGGAPQILFAYDLKVLHVLAQGCQGREI